MFGLTQNEVYIILASVLALLIIVVLLVVFKRKPKVIIPALNYDELLLGLGGKENLVSVAMEHQRLKVKVNELKKVDQAILKKLEIPAFLRGKELTLLIKNHTKDVLSYLSERQKEVN